MVIVLPVAQTIAAPQCDIEDVLYTQLHAFQWTPATPAATSASLVHVLPIISPKASGHGFVIFESESGEHATSNHETRHHPGTIVAATALNRLQNKPPTLKK